jgi:alkylated DNA repair dioxygenase AlkB
MGLRWRPDVLLLCTQKGVVGVGSPDDLILFRSDDATDTVRVNIAALDGASTHQLDGHSWISHASGFIEGHRTLLEQLGDIDGWEQRRRWMYNRVVDEPRLTNEYRDLSLAPNMLREIASALSAYYNVRYDGIWMNWYRDQRDSTSWHADRPVNVAPAAVVPVVSLGDTRRFLIRPNGGGSSVALTVGGGDVVVMHGRSQRDWQHCVPKQKRPATARMSLNFTSTAQVREALS